VVRWLSDDEQQTWQAFIRLRQRLDAALSAGLAQDGLSNADYELLVPLSGLFQFVMMMEPTVSRSNNPTSAYVNVPKP